MTEERGLEYRPLSAERRSEILKQTLVRGPKGGPLRVFGYGSLMWSPCFVPLKASPGILSGYRRRLCILTVQARGTPDSPGLCPALVPDGGACLGVLYTLDPGTASKDLEALFEREMNTGVYHPTWVGVDAGGQRLDALTFVADPAHSQFCGRLDVSEMAELIAGASGRFGSCRDYLASMVLALARLGGAEPELEQLLELVDGRRGRAAPRQRS